MSGPQGRLGQLFVTVVPESTRVAVIVNHLKSTNVDVRAIMPPLRSDEGWTTPSFVDTTAVDPGTGQTRHVLAEDADLTIAAGRDSTVRCVAQALVGMSTPLGLIPLGTGSLLARNLGLDINDPATAARDALAGTDHPIDVPDERGSRQGKAVVLGHGWFGIRRTPHGGHERAPQGGVEIFPGAMFDDGVLDLMTVAPSGTFGWLGVLAGLFNRGRSEDPSIQYFHGKKAEISLERPHAIQFDGDPLGDASHLILSIAAGSVLVRKA